MITEEKENIVREWMRDHPKFIWAEIQADLGNGEILTDNQLEYLLRKYKKAGHINQEKDSGEYQFISTIDKMLADEVEEPEIQEEPENKEPEKVEPENPDSGKENIMPEKKEEKKEPEKAKEKEPDIIQEKLKDIEKIQRQTKPKHVEPKIVVMKQKAESKAEKSEGLSKYFWVIVIGLLVVLVIVYFIWKPKKEEAPAPARKEAEPNRFEQTGFVSAEELFK